MNDVFWLRQGVIAGSAGPNRVPWDIQALKRTGVSAVLSLNDGANIRAEELSAVSILYKCIPLSDNAPPQKGDLALCLEALPRALAFVLSQSDNGKSSLIHCSSGKDRTGLFLCYYLCSIEGLSIETAISEVRYVRPIALSAAGWEAFTYDVLERALE